MRGILIVNPHATSITGTIIDFAVDSLAGLVDLDVERTKYRGHARELAAAAPGELIVVLGGDGSINEVVNGVMSRETDAAPGERPPLIAVIPGGGGNVFARALGLPPDAAQAIRRVKDVIAAGRYRTIGLGLSRRPVFHLQRRPRHGRRGGVRSGTAARVGPDGEHIVVLADDAASALPRNRPADAALTLERDGQPPISGLFLTIITNRSPWTYYRGRAVLPVPNPDFNSGLDLLALRKVSLTSIYNVVIQMLLIRRRPPRGRNLLTVHGAESLTVRSARPIAFQVDGEYLGEVETIEFRFVPNRASRRGVTLSAQVK